MNDTSFSITFNYKTTSRSVQTILQIYNAPDSVPTKWLDVTLNVKKSLIKIQMILQNGPASRTFPLERSPYKKWSKLAITFSQSSSAIQLKSSCTNFENIPVLDDLVSLFLGEHLFVIGGDKSTGSSMFTVCEFVNLFQIFL